MNKEDMKQYMRDMGEDPVEFDADDIFTALRKQMENEAERNAMPYIYETFNDAFYAAAEEGDYTKVEFMEGLFDKITDAFKDEAAGLMFLMYVTGYAIQTGRIAASWVTWEGQDSTRHHEYGSKEDMNNDHTNVWAEHNEVSLDSLTLTLNGRRRKEMREKRQQEILEMRKLNLRDYTPNPNNSASRGG